jgi:hypothetical protein
LFPRRHPATVFTSLHERKRALDLCSILDTHEEAVR